MTPSLFHSTLSSIWDPENRKRSFDFIFRIVDDQFLLPENFEECDALLRHPLTLRMHTKLQVCLLIATNFHKSRLPSRPSLVESAVTSLTVEFGKEETKRIIGNLP